MGPHPPPSTGAPTRHPPWDPTLGLGPPQVEEAEGKVNVADGADSHGDDQGDNLLFQHLHVRIRPLLRFSRKQTKDDNFLLCMWCLPCPQFSVI